MDRATIAIITTLVGAWLLQIFLSNWQMRRFHRSAQDLRRRGVHMAIGVAGTTYRRKTYSVLVVGDDNRVVAAAHLTGFTVLADLKLLPELEMMHLDHVGRAEPPPGISVKTWQALDHAASFIRQKLAKTSTASGLEGEETKPVPVEGPGGQPRGEDTSSRREE